MKDDFAKASPPGGPAAKKGGPGGPPGPFGGGPLGGASIFRAYKYAADYPGLAGRDLKPGPTVEEFEKSLPETKDSEKKDDEKK
jgi:hypothetical protein